jgi:hypothetical protein
MTGQQTTQYAGIKYRNPMRPEVHGYLKSIQEERHFIDLHLGDWVTQDYPDKLCEVHIPRNHLQALEVCCVI